MSSGFGRLYRVTTFGESHGGGLGAIVDGCPPKFELDLERIQGELDRRRPGQSVLTTPRQEADRVEILSGLFEGRTLGTPIGLLIRNRDARPSSYEPFKEIYRPSHADYTYQAKYGIRNWMGGGRASARETAARVAAGAIAAQVLGQLWRDYRCVAWVEAVHRIAMPPMDPTEITRELVDQDPTRCPHPETAQRMFARIDEARRALDSVGGVVGCAVFGVPPGLGEPVFDKLEAVLAQAMLSLPATKGFEIGSGFAGTQMYGSEHNDPYRTGEDGGVITESNRSGGVQGGISNGAPLLFRVAFKPTATIGKPQRTVDEQGRETTLEARGRHDPCVLPRAVPIVEAMVHTVLLDAWLLQRSRSPLY